MRTIPFVSTLLLLFLGLSLAGCGEQAQASKPADLTYTAFVVRLQKTGTSFTQGSATPSRFFAGTPYRITVGSEYLSVFEYPSSADVQKDASHISPRGDKVQITNGSHTDTALVNWVATPHFYKSGRIIVSYIGDQQKMITLLQSLLGPQFAGGDSAIGSGTNT